MSQTQRPANVTETSATTWCLLQDSFLFNHFHFESIGENKLFSGIHVDTQEYICFQLLFPAKLRRNIESLPIYSFLLMLTEVSPLRVEGKYCIYSHNSIFQKWWVAPESKLEVYAIRMLCDSSSPWSQHRGALGRVLKEWIGVAQATTYESHLAAGHLSAEDPQWLLWLMKGWWLLWVVLSVCWWRWHFSWKSSMREPRGSFHLSLDSQKQTRSFVYLFFKLGVLDFAFIFAVF